MGTTLQGDLVPILSDIVQVVQDVIRFRQAACACPKAQSESPVQQQNMPDDALLHRNTSPLKPKTIKPVLIHPT